MRVTAMIAASLALAACRAEDAQPTPHVSPPDLQLVSAGNEPRRVLAYHVDAEAYARLDVVIDSEVDANEAGGPMPTLVLTVSIHVEALMPLGFAMLRATVDDVAARDNPNSQVPAASLGSGLAAMKGFTLRGILAPNGRFQPIRRPPGTVPESIEATVTSLVSSFEQTMMPLPDEAVGVGAVWRSSRPIDASGMKLKAVNTVTVTAADADKLGYTVETELHGDDQSVTQADMKIDVKDIVGQGSGKGTIDLRTLSVSSELISELRSVMSAPGDVEPTKMTMATMTKVSPAGLTIH